ncbi:hypothetical protein SAMN05444392_11645 [Seinonella peptonophila]|uniref:Lasso RiPP family leader peptide-containing protein n=1 Tax=Seinonella peptonophila TaxID=112248 RepID=A0A1M5AWJ3_9BACL|nr:hypothetical protein [Seinonella peptonophila]SHF34641.1 hypothetical protein SAMN05444392_11645 [Seinonella peptonophila]
MKETKNSPKKYTTPNLIVLGNIVDITFGGKDGHNTDTFSTRYPRSE